MRLVVYLLFLLSGATGLVYEVAWTRGLSLTLGSTTTAMSLILAVYMLGLALGARRLGARSDRLRRPLLLYAALEAGIGVLGFLMPLLIPALGRLAGGSRLAAFVLSFAVLLLPTFLMGATLPVLARYVVTRLAGMGGRIGLLYGLNTFGAVAGTFLAGFFLIRLLGVFASTYAAAGVNLLIAGTAALLGAGAEMPVPEEAPIPGPGVEKARDPVRMAAGAAFLSGFVALAAEVLWTRMLVFFLQGFTYTFSAMLATFLLGLSLGAVISGLLVNRIRDLRRYVAWLFLATGLASAGVLLALTRQFEVTNWARDVTAGVFAGARTQYAASLFLASFSILFLPSLVMGCVFPAVVRLATRHLGEVGRRVGTIYAVNTVGSVAGALVAGLVVARVLGMATGAALLSLLAAGAGLWLLPRGWKPRLAALPLVAGAVLLIVAAHPRRPFILHSHVFKGRKALENELLAYEEGSYAAVSVVENARNGVRALYTDEFQAAATGSPYKYMRMLAHLPLLLVPRDEGAEVCVICFGTGTTAGSASVHPLGRLDLVEISPEVLDMAPYFREVNKGILERDPKRSYPVRVHVDDGRNYLLRTGRRFDVITLEPLMPYTPGAVNLYTEDFYRIIRDRLKPGGLACQWIPIHAMSSDDFRMCVRSFAEVFPHTSLWFVEETTMVIGSMEPVRIDLDRILARLRRKTVAEDLAEIGFDDELLLVNTYVASGRALREFVAGAAVMTDEHPSLEFRPVPYKWANTFLHDNLLILERLRSPVSEVAFLGADPDRRAAVKAELDRCYRATQVFLEAQQWKALSVYYGALKNRKREQATYELAMDAYRRALALNPRDPSIRYLEKNARYGALVAVGIHALDSGRYADAAESFRKASAMGNPFKPDVAFALLGRALNRLGRPDDALVAEEKALAIFPGSPGALAERGYAFYLLGRYDLAEREFDRAFAHPAVPPDEDDALSAARKRVRNMRAQGLIRPGPGTEEAVTEALKTLRGGPAAERGRAFRLLRVYYREHPEAVRAALAGAIRAARDPDVPAERQIATLRLLVALGDLPPVLDLLRTGTPAVRGKAADYLTRFRDESVVPALIDAMGDPDPDTRQAAWASFYSITGVRPEGYDPADPPEKRNAALEALRRRWH